MAKRKRRARSQSVAARSEAKERGDQVKRDAAAKRKIAWRMLKRGKRNSDIVAAIKAKGYKTGIGPDQLAAMRIELGIAASHNKGASVNRGAKKYQRAKARRLNGRRSKATDQVLVMQGLAVSDGVQAITAQLVEAMRIEGIRQLVITDDGAARAVRDQQIEFNTGSTR